jgi:hypothetical protein
MVYLEFFPQRLLDTVVLNPHLSADKIKSRPEVEDLLATGDNCNAVTKKILNRLTEGVG